MRHWHDRLSGKYPSYHRWHLFPRHPFWHWFIFASVVFTFSLIIFGGINRYLDEIVPSVSTEISKVSADGLLPSVTVGSLSATQGSTIDIPLTFATGPVAVSALQFNVALPNNISYVSTIAGAASTAGGKSAQGNLVGSNIRIIIFGLNQTAIGSGTLATIRLVVSDAASLGSIPLAITGVITSDINGSPIANTGIGGTITVTTVSTHTPTPTSAPTGYTFCALEGQQCNFSGTRQVQYGTNGVFTTLTFTSTVLCANSVFGDPLPNVAKSCYYSNTTVTPTPTPTPPSTSTLVAHWKLDEGSGLTTLDASVNGNTATLKNSTWTIGKYGSALYFNGSTGYLEAPHSSSLNITGNQIALEAWVYPDVLGTNIIIAKPFSGTSHTSPYFSYSLYAYPNGTPHFFLTLNGVNQYVSSSYIPPVGAWYHLAGVYNGSTMKIYVNGVERGSLSASGNITGYTSPLRLGTNGGLTEKWNGKIDDVRIYSRTLSLSEIQADMGTVISTPTPTPTIIPSPVSKTLNIDIQGSSTENVSGNLVLLNPITKQVISTTSFTSNTSGYSTVAIAPIAADIKISVPSYLVKIVRDVDLASLDTITIPTLTAGDLNNDNIINSLDASIIYSKWFSTTPSDLIVSDLNKDGIINSLDWAILNQNWNKVGDS